MNTSETALITGASNGIGYELAKIFARHGYNLVLVARSEHQLQQLAQEVKKEYNVEAIIFSVDLSKPETVQYIYTELEKKNIAIDYLVNNAGFGDFGFFTETEWEKEQQMIQLNIIALTHLTKLFVKPMAARQKGRVLNVASTAAFQPGPLMAVYYATKAFVLFLSEAIANELKGTGVTVTALCPGPTQSGFQSAAAMEESKLVKNKKLPTAKQVAEYGYKAMMKGKQVAIHGLINKIMAFSIRLTPRRLTTSIVRKLSEKNN
jgi:short-subunit dehydrogenase